MKLIVGLGNPGKEYENTRHNVGFLILDNIRNNFDLPLFKEDKKFNSLISKSNDFIFFKPLTFMNRSGYAISKYLKYYKLKLNQLIVIHDDIDLPFGAIKFSFGQGPAGHKGVESIIDYVGTKDFWRIRIGIKCEFKKKIVAEDFVLKNFSETEMNILTDISHKVEEEIKKFKNKLSDQKKIIIYRENGEK